MPDNFYEFNSSDDSVNKSGDTPSDFCYDKDENIFLKQEEESEDVVYSSENLDFDDSPVIKENNGEEQVPSYPQASYVYPPTPTSVPTYEKPAVSQNPYGTGECEWYGNTPQKTNYIPSENYSKANYEQPQKQNRSVPLVVVILICIAVSVFFGSGAAILTNAYLSDNNSLPAMSDSEEDKSSAIDNISPLTDELSTTTIVEKYADSVVEIITEYVQTGVFSQQYIKSGAGSGVIIDSKGYIVTNYHVIESAERISVTLRDGTTLEAKLVGTDSKMDLALLKVDSDGLSPAVIGNSDSLKVGQRTIAIGNPLGQLGGTVTEGIISALDRNVTVDGQTMNLLQTDTAINPGNSGGGLFDGKGNLIGVVVAKSSGSEVEGLGFAIPINDAVDVISDLMDFGYVRGRISIGMEFIDVTSEPVAWMYGFSNLGCHVYRVDKNSNAEAAGFQFGDLITAIDGVAVNTSEDIESHLEDKKVGDSVEITVVRGRNKGTISLELEELIPESENNVGDYIVQWYYD